MGNLDELSGRALWRMQERLWPSGRTAVGRRWYRAVAGRRTPRLSGTANNTLVEELPMNTVIGSDRHASRVEEGWRW